MISASLLLDSNDQSFSIMSFLDDTLWDDAKWYLILTVQYQDSEVPGNQC